MAIILKIPSQYVDGFKNLLTITDKQFNSIFDKISLTSLVSSIERLVDLFEDEPIIDIDIVEDIFNSVGSLSKIIDNEVPMSVIVDDIYESLLNELKESISKKDYPKEIFTSRLTKLLETERFYYAAKTSELMYDYGNVYIHSTITSDIRPIFGININEDLKAGIIIHNLHIHYESDKEGSHKDIHFALDSNDLDKLEEIIEVAKKKELTLKRLLDKANIINLTE